MVPFFVITLLLFQALPLRVVHDSGGEHLQLEEAFFVPMALLLTPLQTLLTLAVTVLAAHAWNRRSPSKAAFNCGQMVCAAALGLGVSRLIGAGAGVTTVEALGGAVAGGLAFAMCSAAAVAAILSVAQQASFVGVLRQGLPLRLASWIGSVALGLIVVLAVRSYSWALWVALVPTTMLQLGLAGALAQWRHREQMEALYQVAVELRGTTTPALVHERLLTAAGRLLEAREARVVPHSAPLTAGTLRVELDGDLSIEVGERIGGGAWRARERKLLGTLAEVGAVALRTARLFDEITHQAAHDRLTGLPNQVLFEDRVNQAMVQAGRTGTGLAVLFLDLDGFKKVNDSLGHAAGDALLRQVAHRLGAVVRTSDTLARMGGDEFTVLATPLAQDQHVDRLADKLLAALNKPFTVGRSELFISVSIGVACYPSDASGYEGLMKNADSAMYKAKSRGRGIWERYSPAMNALTFARLALEGDLHNALQRDELELHYQAQVDLTSGAIVGVEALVRWQHPSKGLLGPDKFISLAEESGLIIDLDDWVLRTACKQARQWLADGLPPIQMGVNVSARHLQLPRLLTAVTDALEESGLEARWLELEVTEGAAGQDGLGTMSMLGHLKDLGVRMAIDDFGTGYSVLDRLRRFPIDKVKIDKSFVDEIPENGSDAPIVTAMIAMAHSLGLVVVAEGVETAHQLRFLRDGGCDQMQGYLFSRPVPAGAMAPLLARQATGALAGAVTSSA